MFHATIAELLVAQARAVRADHGISDLGLTGGVFQNRLLCECVIRTAGAKASPFTFLKSCRATTPA